MHPLLRLAGLAFVVLGYLLLNANGLWGVSKVLTGFCGLMVSFLLVEIYRTKDPTFGFPLAAKRYVLFWLIFIKGYFVERQLASVTKSLRQSQAQTLSKILRTNSGTVYSREHGLDKISTREELRETHPLCGYDRFASYYERMTRGEKNVLTTEKPFAYGITSGTTGKPSTIAVLQSSMDTMIKVLFPFAFYKCAGRNRSLWGTRRQMLFYSHPEGTVKRTADGSKIGQLSGLTFKRLFTDEMWTSPSIAFNIPDLAAVRYSHLLFGLHYRDLTLIQAPYVAPVYWALRYLESNWVELVDDIRHGTLKNDLHISVEHRAELLMHLRANPARADELEREFRRGMDGILRRVWPEMKTIFSICTGSFAPYKSILQETFAKDLLLYHFLYASTEATLGVNIWPGREPAVYLLLPVDVFYEFIPTENISDAVPPTVYLEQLEMGKEYEMVLTTMNGLSRYRLGDVVKVRDFYNQCPVVEILHRTSQLLNIKGEQVSEQFLFAAMIKALAELADVVTSLVDFTSCENGFVEQAQGKQERDDGTLEYYVIFLELMLRNPEVDGRELQSGLSEMLDKHLRQVHGRYDELRTNNEVAPLQVILTRSGAFQSLCDLMLRNPMNSPQQMKMPRVLKKPELIKHMLEQRLS